MEIIRAILSIFLGLIFLSFIIRISYPLLMIAGVFILFTVIRVTFMNKSYKNRANGQRTQSTNNQRQNRQTTNNQSTASNNPNVIDAEFTEEELD